jgi:hypothetical protein
LAKILDHLIEIVCTSVGVLEDPGSVLQGPARPESRGLGPAQEGLGFYFLRPEPSEYTLIETNHELLTLGFVEFSQKLR